MGRYVGSSKPPLKDPPRRKSVRTRGRPLFPEYHLNTCLMGIKEDGQKTDKKAPNSNEI